jgi:hypothetical protein
MNREAQQAAESVAKIRQLLAKWLKASDESRGPVADILNLLEPLDAYVRAEMVRPSGSRKPAKEANGSGTTYSMAVKNGLELLTEKRAGGSQPYRVPKYLFDATVGALAGSDSAMEFEDVMKGVGKKLPEPPVWQVRAVLRFLLNAQPHVILKERNKYRPVQPSKLAADAAKGWAALAKASKRGV